MNLRGPLMYGDARVPAAQGTGYDEMIKITDVCVVPRHNERGLAR